MTETIKILDPVVDLELFDKIMIQFKSQIADLKNYTYDKTNIDETLIPSNNNSIILKNNNKNDVMNNVIKCEQELSKLVKKHGIKYVNRLRNNIIEGENINHISKICNLQSYLRQNIN